MGLFHPRCRHGLGTYYPELEDINGYETEDNKLNDYGSQQANEAHIDNMIQKYKRLTVGSLDPDNVRKYQERLEYWEYQKNESEKSHSINKEVEINKEYIYSSEYKEKFRGITGVEEIDNLICKKARDILKHRNKTYFEDMHLINIQDGVVASQTHSTTIQTVQYNKSLTSAIKNYPDYSLISIHNHPESKPPSGGDLYSCGKRKYKMGIICCHNGDVYTYKCGKNRFHLYFLIKRLTSI